MNMEKSIRKVDAVVVGAGFGGLYALYKLREQGLEVCGIEAGSGVGGTWFWNSYPDARCDVESLQYSYSFSKTLEQEWRWPERYSAQPELLAYLNHVADRFDLRPLIKLNTRVVSAVFDEDANLWRVETDDGDVIQCTYCVMATGNLSLPRVPEFDGLSSYEGKWYHTGNWPKDEKVDFSGLRVGVIGTGSSGIQVFPEVAKVAKHVHVFQRTPNYCVPAANRPMTDEADREFKANYAERRQQAQNTPFCMGGHPAPTKGAMEVSEQERDETYQRKWEIGGAVNFLYTYKDLLTSAPSNKTAADFVRRKIREIVKNPEVAELLCPDEDTPIGAKRLCVSDPYFPAFNRDNVTLVDVRSDPIVGLEQKGIRTTNNLYELDAVVFATGFDAITGALAEIDIRGPGGYSLKEAWSQGPKCFLGLMVAGLPNMFIVTGPQSPSVKANLVCAIEQHVDWIADCLNELKKRNAARIEVTQEAQEAWSEHCNAVANATLYAEVDSWYTGSNVPGKPRFFAPYVGGFDVFRRKCDEVARNGYQEFHIGVAVNA